MKYAVESYLLQERNNYSSTMNQILWYWDVHNCRGAKRFLCLPATENTCSDLLLAAGTVRHTLLWHIAVTTAINMKGGEGGRRKLVYSCGEIGLYPPRRWAQHTCVVDLHICGGLGEGGGRKELPPPRYKIGLWLRKKELIMNSWFFFGPEISSL